MTQEKREALQNLSSTFYFSINERKQASFTKKYSKKEGESERGELYMSAYMVEDKTINRVVNWLSREVYKNSYLRQKTEEVFGISVESKKWAETVG